MKILYLIASCIMLTSCTQTLSGVSKTIAGVGQVGQKMGTSITNVIDPILEYGKDSPSNRRQYSQTGRSNSRDRVGGHRVKGKRMMTLREWQIMKAKNDKILIENDQEIRKINISIKIVEEKMRKARTLSERDDWLYAKRKLQNDRRRRINRLTKPADSYGWRDIVSDFKASYHPRVLRKLKEVSDEALKRTLTGSQNKR